MWRACNRRASSTDSAPSTASPAGEKLAQSLQVLEFGNRNRNKKRNVSARRTLDGHKRYSGVLLMASFIRAAAQALALGSIALAGCSGDGSDSFLGSTFTTGALGTQAAAPEPKVDPACVSLASRIEALRKEGIAEKIEKALPYLDQMVGSGLVAISDVDVIIYREEN